MTSVYEPEYGSAATATALIPVGVAMSPICRSKYFPDGEGPSRL